MINGLLSVLGKLEVQRKLLIKSELYKVIGSTYNRSVPFNSAMEHLGFFIVSIFLLPALTHAQLPNGACVSDYVSCAITGDNLVGLVDGVSSAEECRQFCEETPDSCEFYSYFGPASYPFDDACLLFSNCTTLEQCTDCLTEDVECYFCAAAIEGHVGDNLIEIWDDVEDEALCEERCRSTSGCNFYTYHRSNSTLFTDTCFLLTDLEQPVLPCDGNTCSSGSPDCKSTLCSFVNEEGILHPYGLVVNETEDIGIVRIGSCPTSVLAVVVGGGGHGTYPDYPPQAGAGSGYIQQAELSGAVLPYTILNAYVGDKGEYSSLTDASGNVVRADKGGDSYSDGGSGYSGGGGGGSSSNDAGAGWSLIAATKYL